MRGKKRKIQKTEQPSKQEKEVGLRETVRDNSDSDNSSLTRVNKVLEDVQNSLNNDKLEQAEKKILESFTKE